MPVGDAANCCEPGFAWSTQVPPDAAEVTWSGAGNPSAVANRYGVVGALRGAGVDAARIRVFHEPEDGGTYWVVSLDGGRTAVLTDATEEHVGHVEGPWPFKVTFLSQDRTRTRVDLSLDGLLAHIIAWYTEAAGPQNDSR
jgi:hypothetical protein